MSTISTNINAILKELPEGCTLVAVSKTKPNEDIISAYDAGHRDFGENKVQELAAKAEVLSKDIHWHMIGHLQRNKVKYIAPFVHLIHGVDSLRLLKEINKQAVRVDRNINCLLQVHIAEESTKFGFDEDELLELMNSEELSILSNISIVGLMGMATFTNDLEQIRREFRSLRSLFNQISEFNHSNIKLHTLSMGMSGDYKIAIEEGSNMVRIGSAIFGERS